MTITVTPTLELANIPPRVRLNVAASAGETSTTVERLNPDGTLVPVRTTDGNPLPISGGAGLVYDYEAPFGQPVSYSSLESPATVSAEVTVAITDVWLIHPGVPSLSMIIALRPGTLRDETFIVKQAVVYPMGRTNPWTANDGSRKSSQSVLIVVTGSDVELQSLKDLIADAGVLLLNIPDGMNTGFTTSYIAISDVKVSRWSDGVIDWNRDVTLPFVVVDRPVGGSQAQRTWPDVPAAYASWTAVKAHYSTWSALLAGP